MEGRDLELRGVTLILKLNVVGKGIFEGVRGGWP